jgi:hypothetical protein
VRPTHDLCSLDSPSHDSYDRLCFRAIDVDARQELVRGLKAVVDSVSTSPTPVVGNNELLRALLLDPPAPSPAFLAESILPLLDSPDANVQRHCRGARGLLRRHLARNGVLVPGRRLSIAATGDDGEREEAHWSDVLKQQHRQHACSAGSSGGFEAAATAGVDADDYDLQLLLSDLAPEWQFRNPDFEREIGALKDINKRGVRVFF